MWHAGSSVLRDRSGGKGKPLISFTVSPEDGETEVLGKYTSELQSNVSIRGGVITGKLNYVDDYTGFSGDPSMQEGNYLVLRVDTDDEDDVITVELIGGTVGHPITLDADRNIVLRITDCDTQSIRIVVTHEDEEGHTSTATQNLSLGLDLLPPSNDEEDPNA